MSNRNLSQSEHNLRVRIRLQLRRMQHGLDRDATADAILAAVQDREGALRECLMRGTQTVH